MNTRLRTLGFVLAVIGLAFFVAGGVAFGKTRAGYRSLQAFSSAQNVELTYNESGELTDRGEPAGAEAIMSLLVDDWQYPVVESDLDPADPLVNTASEYMFQMATISFHTLNGTQTVTLEEDVEYNGETFKAGTYEEVPVDGRYWTAFDREHPIDGLVREQAWSGTAHGLTGELGVGTVTHSALQMALGLAALLGGLGGVFVLTGLGLAWASSGKRETEADTSIITIPERELAGV